MKVNQERRIHEELSKIISEDSKGFEALKTMILLTMQTKSTFKKLASKVAEEYNLSGWEVVRKLLEKTITTEYDRNPEEFLEFFDNGVQDVPGPAKFIKEFMKKIEAGN